MTEYTKECAGATEPYERIFGYFEDLLAMSVEKKTPIFLYSWATGLTHDDMNALQTADEYLENFLGRLNLDNSILFVMGDHGYRFGKFRETHIGWFEDKLPWLSIFLPPALKIKYPHWVEALEINSR
jgi:hypothetical protein